MPPRKTEQTRGFDDPVITLDLGIISCPGPATALALATALAAATPLYRDHDDI